MFVVSFYRMRIQGELEVPTFVWQQIIVNRRRSPFGIGIGPLLVFFRMRDRARSVHR